MKTIDDLLDDLEVECYDYCYGRRKKLPEARAAVDAEIKRMQDRIAALEREINEFIIILRKYDSALLKQLMSETTSVAEIK